MGLTSDKNFIVANAVENILAAPKIPPAKTKDYLKKKDFGTKPKYLETIRQDIEKEYEMVREMRGKEEEEKEKERFLLPDDERKALVEQLKKKWEIVHKEYQGITHITKVDTLGLKNKKEKCEKELAALEKDIAKLSKNYIFVDTTH